MSIILTQKGIDQVKQDINKVDSILKDLYLKGHTTLAVSTRDDLAKVYTKILNAESEMELNHNLELLAIKKKWLIAEIEHIMAKAKVEKELSLGLVADEATWRSRENLRLFMEQVNKF